ncbi:MAG: hypothetical protein AAGK97_05360, partial [Bacteroidota bacterium]
KALIESQGTLHKNYTKVFEESYPTGYVKRDLVFELEDGNFLYVFDKKEKYIGGKGDIYFKDYFLRLVKWNKRVKDDYANDRGSSIKHWSYYSKKGIELTNSKNELIEELGKELKISIAKLDNSYKSLDVVSEQIESYGIDEAINNLYDNLVLYVGEVLKEKVGGTWQIDTIREGAEYPFISIGLKNIQYMPINIVWNQLVGLENVNLRKEAGNEARQVGIQAKYEKQIGAKLRDLLNNK